MSSFKKIMAKQRVEKQKSSFCGKFVVKMTMFACGSVV
jgi:hypothetical protein